MSRQSGCRLLFSIDRVAQVFGALLAEAFELADLLPVEVIDVACVMNPAEIDEAVRQLGAEPGDIHRGAADEVMHALFQLRRAGGVGAIAHRHAWLPVRRRTT